MFAHACDVSKGDSVAAAFEAVCSISSGGVDILVNNAGVAAVGTVVKATEEDMDRVYNVNVKSVFFCSGAAVRSMLKHGRGGSIVNIASIASLVRALLLQRTCCLLCRVGDGGAAGCTHRWG